MSGGRPERQCEKELATSTSRIGVLGSAIVSILIASSAEAQSGIVITGRVDDAVTLEPLAGVRVIAGDSASSTLTDAAGRFSLSAAPGVPLVLYAEKTGYPSTRFDLPPDAAQRPTILRLAPAPVELEGITAVAQQAIEELQKNIRTRRNSYGEGAVWGFDREWLERFGPKGGTVLEVVQRRNPRIRPCRNWAGLCTPGRGPTPRNPFPETGIKVCIDDWLSMDPETELDLLPIESVALVEMIGKARINVYTTLWMLRMAEHGRTNVHPLIWPGC